MQDCLFTEWLLSSCDWNFDWPGKVVEWGRLAAELEPHKPLNGFALIGNDLCLPYQGNRHEAHKKNGKDENDNNIGLVNRKAEDAAKPSHGKGPPSTGKSAHIWIREAESSTPRAAFADKSKAIGGPRLLEGSNSYPTENRWFVRRRMVLQFLIAIGSVQIGGHLRDIFSEAARFLLL